MVCVGVRPADGSSRESANGVVAYDYGLGREREVGRREKVSGIHLSLCGATP